MEAMIETLTKFAKEASDRAYAPYSNFSVGAAICAQDGQVFYGANVENVAYPQGVCAEASAISAMVTSGVRHIEHILVYCEAETAIFPCGGCRQKILEFADQNTMIHIASDKGLLHSMKFSELVPYSFSTKDLT